MGIAPSSVDSADKLLEVALLWQDYVLEVRHFRGPMDISFGNSKEATFCIADETAPKPLNTIARLRDNICTVRFENGGCGTITREKRPKILSSCKVKPWRGTALALSWPSTRTPWRGSRSAD